MGQVAYQLALPKDCHLHPVFHVSQLKRVEGVTQATAVGLPLTADLEEVLQPLRHFAGSPIIIQAKGDIGLMGLS